MGVAGQRRWTGRCVRLVLGALALCLEGRGWGNAAGTEGAEEVDLGPSERGQARAGAVG